MDDTQSEALMAALDAYAEKKCNAAYEAGHDQGVRTVFNSLLRQAVKGFPEAGMDTAEAEYQHAKYAAAIDHMIATWPWLDES